MDRHIVVVDDTKALAHMYASALEDEGFRVTPLYSGAALLSFLASGSFLPDLLILDIKLPDMDGLDILARLKDQKFNAPVIVITGHGSIHTAVESMRLGAADFLVKPFAIEKLIDSAGRAVRAAGLTTKAEIAVRAGDDKAGAKNNTSGPVRAGFASFIGISEPMQLVYDVIENAAKSNASVFITGESGTGKELCAEAVHKYSRRSKGPFIAVNCAAIPHDLMESELFGHVKGAFTNAIADRRGAVAQAEGGTLFLDEIAEMPLPMQTKLLRFLQNLTYREVGGADTHTANVRIVCATNRDPLEEISRGRLRQDLYYRLHVIPVHLPPLRERANDIIDLADFFLKTHAREEGKMFRSFSPEAERILTAYDWPGNVRELQNMCRNIAVMQDGRVVTGGMIPALIRAAAEAAARADQGAVRAWPENTESRDLALMPLWKIEKCAIERAIAACEGNIPKAAAMLEISPSTIYRKKMGWEKMPPAPLGGPGGQYA